MDWTEFEYYISGAYFNIYRACLHFELSCKSERYHPLLWRARSELGWIGWLWAISLARITTNLRIGPTRPIERRAKRPLWATLSFIRVGRPYRLPKYGPVRPGPIYISLLACTNWAERPLFTALGGVLLWCRLKPTIRREKNAVDLESYQNHLVST